MCVNVHVCMYICVFKYVSLSACVRSSLLSCPNLYTILLSCYCSGALFKNFSIVLNVVSYDTTLIEKSLNEDLPVLIKSINLSCLVALQKKDDKLFKKGSYVLSPVCV